MIQLGKLPSQPQKGLQSKSLTAKKMVTALNAYARTNKITHKAKAQFIIPDLLRPLENLYQAMTDDGKTVDFDNYREFFSSLRYQAPSEKFPNKIIEQFFSKSIYTQNPYFNMCYYDRNRDKTYDENLRMLSNEDNSVSIVLKTFDNVFRKLYNSQIPLPALKTENGETKTTFIPNGNSDCYHEASLKSVFDSQINVENIDVDESIASKMYDLANTINDTSPEKAQEFKKQFNMIDFFQNNKDEVFNKPVELATKAYDELKGKPDTPIGTLEIMDLSESVDGERIEFARQGNVFNITSYDKNNEKSMCGQFEILKDENGVPLKENNDGKILNQNDENYDDPQNKLCFNMQVLTYHEGIDQILSKFERNINLSDAKHRQNIKMSRYDRNGAFVREEEASTPLHSKKCLLKRMCKVYYNVYKSDLKEAKANFEHDMLNPDDLDPNLKSWD